MKIKGSVYSLTALAGLAAFAMGASSAAQARDVYWSVGIAAPGAQVGLSNAPPVVYHYPVVVAPQPVYAPYRPIVVQPSPIYYGQPQYYGPPQVIYVPQPVYGGSGWVPPGHRQGWGPRHFHRERWDRDDNRRGRDDRRGWDDRGHRDHR